MRGSVVDNGLCSLLGFIARPYDIEASIAQKLGSLSRQSSRARRVQHFHLDAHTFRRTSVVGY
jgi:hypothetical protein